MGPESRSFTFPLGRPVSRKSGKQTYGRSFSFPELGSWSVWIADADPQTDRSSGKENDGRSDPCILEVTSK